MIRLSLVLILGLVGPASADTDTAPKEETCQSCNARHNALKKLQDTRIPPPTKPALDPTVVEPKDE